MLLLVFLPKVGGFNITVFPFTCLSACLLCILRVLRDRSRMLFQNQFLQTYKLFPIIQLISQNYFSAQILIEAQRKAKGVFAFPQLDPKTCRASLLKSLETFWNHRNPLGSLGIMGSLLALVKSLGILLAQCALKSQTMV